MDGIKKEPAAAATATSLTNDDSSTTTNNHTTALQLCQEVLCILSDDIPESMDSNNRFACYLVGYAAAKLERAAEILKEGAK